MRRTPPEGSVSVARPWDLLRMAVPDGARGRGLGTAVLDVALDHVAAQTFLSRRTYPPAVGVSL